MIDLTNYKMIVKDYSEYKEKSVIYTAVYTKCNLGWKSEYYSTDNIVCKTVGLLCYKHDCENCSLNYFEYLSNSDLKHKLNTLNQFKEIKIIPIANGAEDIPLW